MKRLAALLVPFQAVASAPLRQQLEQANAALVPAWRAEDAEALLARYRRLVMERSGGEHAGLFLADALCLPHCTPMPVGRDAIGGYFVGHERPGPVEIVALERIGAIRSS